MEIRLSFLFNSLLVLSFLYVLSFYFLPDELRLVLAGVLTFAYFCFLLRSLFKRADSSAALIITGVLLIVAAWIGGLLFEALEINRERSFLLATSRAVSPFVVGAAVLLAYSMINVRVLFTPIILLLFFAWGVALTEPSYVLRGTERFAPFTGGDDGLHSSAYAVASCLFLLYAIYLRGFISRRLSLLAASSAVGLLMGYGVRTAILSVLLFGAIVAANYLVARLGRKTETSAIIISSFGVVATIAAWYISEAFSFDQLSTFSSGRLITYHERFEMIAERSISQLLFGTGPGSDYFTSSSWSWEEKDSHNDFIHMLIENGMVGLSGMLVYIIGIARFGGVPVYPVLGAVLASSVISNAFFSRPAIIPLVFIAMALLVSSGGKQARFSRHISSNDEEDHGSQIS